MSGTGPTRPTPPSSSPPPPPPPPRGEKDEHSGIDGAGEHERQPLAVIVVGAHPKAETSDRPTAYRLQRRISEWLEGAGADSGNAVTEDHHFAAALVITDVWYLNDRSLKDLPLISIGGPGVNALSAYLGDKVPTAFAIDDVLMVQADPAFEELRVACWGITPDATASAVDAFCERYLDGFLTAAAARAG